MELSNLISGLIGAVIAVVLSELFTYFSILRRRMKYRQILKNYLSSFVLNGLSRYITDVEVAISEINDYPSSTHDLSKYDTIPSLNGNILKQMDFNELFFITKDADSHALLIDTYHCIDYLKLKMPSEYVIEFRKFGEEHFKVENLKSLERKIEHLKTCEQIPSAKKLLINSLNDRKNTSTEVLSRVKSLILRL